MNAKQAFFSLLCAITAIILSGCGKPATYREIDIPSSVMPHSDIVCIIDVKTIRESTIIKKSTAKESQPAKGAGVPERSNRPRKSSGLSNSDILDVVISADLTSISVSNQDNTAILANLSGMAVIHLSTNLTMNRLREDITAFAQERMANARLSECTIDGNSVLRIEQTGTNDLPGYFALSKNGRSVFMTLNEKSMVQTLAPRSSAPDQQVALLAAAEKMIPRESQVRMAMVIGDSTRAGISKQIAVLNAAKSKDTKNAVLYSFVKPFENIRSVMFNATFATNVQANLAADLGTEEQAMQAKNTIELMLVPVLAMAPGNAAGLLPANVLQRIDIVHNGSLVNLSLKLTESDLEAIANPPPEPSAPQKMLQPGTTNGDSKPTAQE